MIFDRNPVVVRVKAEITEGKLRFEDDTRALRFWTGREGRAPKLRITRGFRQNGEEFDPRSFVLQVREPFDCDSDGFFRVDLVFHGRALTAYLDKAELDSRRDFARVFRVHGAGSLYQAFIAQERIQLYVEELDPEKETDEPLRDSSLGSLLIELSYFGCD